MDQAKVTNAANPGENANILSKLFFGWINPLFWKGRNKELEVSDLYAVLSTDSSQRLGDRLERHWNVELEKNKINPKKPPSLAIALSKLFFLQYMFHGFVGLVEECFTRVVQPLCLGKVISYFSDGEGGGVSSTDAYLYAMGIVLCAAFYTTTHHPYFFGSQHIGMRMRVASCSLVYRKALKLSKGALGRTTIGQLVNLLSNDVNRFDQSVVYLNYIWIGPAQICIVCGVLWTLIGPSCLVGLAVLLLFVPFQSYMGKLFSGMRSKTAMRTDERIRVMNEILSGMRVIKMYTWEKPFIKLIDLARKVEVNVIRKSSYLRAVNLSMFYCANMLIIYLTFLCYALLGNIVRADQVFVTMSLYNYVRLVMTLYFPSAIQMIAETRVSIRRLQDFLLMEERNDELHPGIEIVNKRSPPEEVGIWMKNFTAKWNPEVSENTLTNVSFEVRPGKLLAVIGPVGCGKGSLLHAVLGELPPDRGTVKYVGKIAYTSQEPWVFAGSVRQNVTFGEAFDEKKYRKVVECCALKTDLEQLPYGDRTLVGDRGSSLSGGQKARVNLARAVYLDADVYLLDDPLSAVDTHVGRHLFEECVMKYLRHKARILVTHQLQYLKKADEIIILRNGHVEAQGSFEDLIHSGVDFAKLLAEEEDQKRRESQLSKRRESQLSRRSSTYTDPGSDVQEALEDGRRRASSVHDDYEDQPQLAAPKAVEEMRSHGSMGWGVYKEYMRAGASWCNIMLLFLVNIIAQVFISLTFLWLTYWTDEADAKCPDTYNNITDSSQCPSGYDQDWYIDIYSCIIAILIVLSFIRTFWFFVVCMNSSEALHNTMFVGIVKAPIKFFDDNPVGRILNRFSKDIGQIDDLLPATFFDMVGIVLMILGILVQTFIVNWFLIIPTFIIAIIFVFLRGYYLKTARDVKRLEGITRSPVFSHLSATLQGLTTIRAFEVETLFKEDFDIHQDIHSSSWYLFLATARWFGLCLDWLCVIYLGVVTFSFFGLVDLGLLSAQGGQVGMAISSAMMLTGTFQWGVRQSSEVENLMVSVERVIEYTHVPQEAGYESSPDKKPPADWPSGGEIIFDNMSLRYGPDDPPVLKNLNCKIRAQEKIGIVGRTGAGKSSMLAALFRMTEPDGAIIIDGIPTKDVGLYELRSKISIIPQDPVLFTGTLRVNLDPFNEFSDDNLWSVLEEVELKGAVDELPHGLQSQMSEGGSNFSVGQRQLVCLARAILRRNRILVLDEATANVDPKTDAMIQSTIRKKFGHCTVMTIAHRLNTIMDSDRVMVMDAGMLKEFDVPYFLVQNTESQFYEMVQQTGKSTANLLLNLARKAYEDSKNKYDSYNDGTSATPAILPMKEEGGIVNQAYRPDSGDEAPTSMQTTVL